MPSVLFVKTSSLGDVIHHMPAVTDARRHWPTARIAWVVEEAYAPLVAQHPAVNQVIPVASRRWRHEFLKPSAWREVGRFIGSLRAERYDDIVDAQGLLRSALIAKLARGRSHGYDAHSIREPLAANFYAVRHAIPRTLHAIARNRALTGQALNYVADGEIDYGLPRRGSSSLRLPPYAVLLHGTARPEKQWPEQHWVALGRALARQGLEILVPWGSGEEQERSQRLAAQLPGAKVPARAPIDGIATAIAGAAVVVGVDTGLLHLAAAFAVPLVAIFVGSEPGLTGPMGGGPISIVGSKGTIPSAEEVVEAVTKTAHLQR